jgi:hypothetical protein
MARTVPAGASQSVIPDIMKMRANDKFFQLSYLLACSEVIS